MLRAFLTVVIELMAVADDSYGSLGDSFHDGFAKYLEIPLEKTGIEDTVFFHDLAEWILQIKAQMSKSECRKNPE